MPAGELTRRVGVAVVGIPVVLGLLYYGGWILGVPLAVFAALGVGEVCDLAESGGVKPFRALGMASAAALVLLAVAMPEAAGLAPWALAGLLVVTGVALLMAMAGRGPDGAPLAAVSITVFGVLYVAVALAFVVLLHALPGRFAWGGATGVAWGGLLVVMLPLAATWIGDSAAYFLGTAFGRAKIAPSISPNKSWVGGAAGLLGSAVGAVLWLVVATPLLPELPIRGMGAAVGMGVLIGAAGQVGDFAESLLKREAGVKDSGRLFPGHGGLLDRLDALIPAFPVAYALLALAEYLS